MGKLIQFPTGKEITTNKDGEHPSVVDTIIGESMEISQHMVSMMEYEILDMDLGWLEGFDIRDEQYCESRDAFVIANLVYAMLLRYIDLPHSIQKDMDKLYIKLKKLQQGQSAPKDEEPDNDTT